MILPCVKLFFNVVIYRILPNKSLKIFDNNTINWLDICLDALLVLLSRKYCSLYSKIIQSRVEHLDGLREEVLDCF